jgi:hypothetical protein
LFLYDVEVDCYDDFYVGVFFVDDDYDDAVGGDDDDVDDNDSTHDS